ncbi:MAG: Protein OS-9 [Bogoriella megaspora]|nr:MAG: Protein OS-9 [Bogoriella megaspora]
MMKNFWALPAVLRVALANSHSFSVNEDLLAYPQYEVIFSDTFISDSFASSRLAWASSSSARASATDLPSTDSNELSNPLKPPKGDAQDAEFDEDVSTYEKMHLNGRRYLCSIPRVSIEDDGHSGNSGLGANGTSSDELEKELTRANDRGLELLKGLQGNCLYFMSGWWSYSFCYNDGVRQFHPLPPSRGVSHYPPIEDPTVPGFELGVYGEGRHGKKKEKVSHVVDEEDDGEGEKAKVKKSTAETALAKLETKGEVRYIVQKLGGGSVCDLTGKDRKVEVQFHCNPNSVDRIGLIKEVAICSYLMVIHTPRLCDDVAFHPPQESTANTILCKEILREDEVSAWKERKTLEAEELLTVGEAEHKPIRSIVGGIEVGAKKDVGTEGKVIEKSVVVGGGKETYIDTLASSDGKTIDEKALKRLNMMTAKELELLKQQLQNLAKGKGWKLDAVDTPRGRELRGIIDNEDDEAKSTEKKSGDEDYDEDEVEGSEETYKEEL